MVVALIMTWLIPSGEFQTKVNEQGQEVIVVFGNGAAELTSTALLIGFARSIALLLEDGEILHTMIHTLATPLSFAGAELAAIGMLIIQSILNLFIPSGSGQAFVTMPLMAPIGDLAGISRQISVLAFQFGDGLMNMIVPTNPVLMGILGLAGIPYDKWFRFIFPLLMKLLVLCSVALVVALWIGYQ
ncbi:MAG: TIGR00366 family protein [Balneolales bacterium]